MSFGFLQGITFKKLNANSVLSLFVTDTSHLHKKLNYRVYTVLINAEYKQNTMSNM